MKKVIMLSVCSIMFFAACNNSNNNNNAKTNVVQPGTFDTTKLAPGTAFYQCPMDAEVVSDQPGTCSKCGMDLEKVEKK